MEPITAAAMPATCPIGSIAMAFKFPKIRPKLKNIAAMNNTNIHNCISAMNICVTKNRAELPIINWKARTAIVCIPNLCTKRELIKDDTPKTKANIPK